MRTAASGAACSEDPEELRCSAWRTRNDIAASTPGRGRDATWPRSVREHRLGVSRCGSPLLAAVPAIDVGDVHFVVGLCAPHLGSLFRGALQQRLGRPLGRLGEDPLDGRVQSGFGSCHAAEPFPRIIGSLGTEAVSRQGVQDREPVDRILSELVRRAEKWAGRRFTDAEDRHIRNAVEDRPLTEPKRAERDRVLQSQRRREAEQRLQSGSSWDHGRDQGDDLGPSR